MPPISRYGNTSKSDGSGSAFPSVLPNGLGIPKGALANCRGNTMVWLGSGPYPARLPSCFTVTRDENVWNRAVAKWKQDHDR